jgi:rod shape-determining protein MreB
MFRSWDVGIDLGTVNTLVYVRGKGIVLSEPSVLAISELSGEIVAAGEEAWKMIGRTPQFIRTVRPLTEGTITDYEIAELMLRHYLQRAGVNRLIQFFRRSRVLVAAPVYLTEVESGSVKDAVKNALGEEVFLVPESLAAAVGSGLPVLESKGSMVVDIGGGTAEIAVISGGGIVKAASLRQAGDQFNRAIADFVAKEFNLKIGEAAVESVKLDLGAAFPGESRLKEKVVSGKDLTQGIPRQVNLTGEMISKALLETIEEISRVVVQVLEETPPDLVADILETGMVLTGGSGLLPGLDKFISQRAKVAVVKTEDPLTTVVRGTGIILEDFPKYQKLVTQARFQISNKQ